MEGEVRVTKLRKVFGSTGIFERLRSHPTVLEEITFSLSRGECAAVVGESGSGKTTLGRCVLGLLPFNAEELTVNGFNVGRLGKVEEKSFRMSAQMVFQNPYASLNPAFRAKTALLEAIRIHSGKLPKARADQEVERLAALVQLPMDRLNAYPPELSGGEKRRVVFARALATSPQFIVTDEPLSGLDQPIQAQLLELLRKIQQRHNTTMLFISHDLRLVRFIATRVMVMHRGRIVEDAPSETFFGEGPIHPYSQELLESAFRADPAQLNLGHFPPPPRDATGCLFRHRCVLAKANMSEACLNLAPHLLEMGPGHRVACHLCTKECP